AREDGHIKQVGAPGHRRKRCCYVDFLSTGPAVAGTLRRQVSGMAHVRRLSNIAVIEICVAAGHVRGAVALDLSTGSLLTIAARTVILASYAILKEVEAGRGSPHGGVYLDFRHVPDDSLREAFGPVIDRLLKNGIDLTQVPIEVAPTAHYHMGGIAVNDRMETRVAGLF